MALQATQCKHEPDEYGVRKLKRWQSRKGQLSWGPPRGLASNSSRAQWSNTSEPTAVLAAERSVARTLTARHPLRSPSPERKHPAVAHPVSPRRRAALASIVSLDLRSMLYAPPRREQTHNMYLRFTQPHTLLRSADAGAR